MLRNYDAVPNSSCKGKGNFLQCPGCNKKYKTEKKRQEHVTKAHYYLTRHSNNLKIDQPLRTSIYDLAKEYVMVLHRINLADGDTISAEETLCAKKLLPQLYDPHEPDKKINAETLTRIIVAQKTFAKRLFSENLLTIDWPLVMDDLESFFRMGLPHYDTNFCPTLLIDFLWHAIMQNRDVYTKLCRESCVEIMPHCNNERSAEEDQKRHEYFLEVFKQRFRRDPYIPRVSDVGHSFDIATVEKLFVDLRDMEFKKQQDDLLRLKNEREQRNVMLPVVVHLGAADNRQSMASSC